MNTLNIHIRPGGFLANQMFQYMLAKTIEHRSGKETHITGQTMPEWNLEAGEHDVPADKVFEIKTNFFDLDALIKDVQSGLIDHVVIKALGMRLEYFEEADFYNQFFQPPASEAKKRVDLSEKDLLVHVRGGDVLQGAHQDYFPLPFHYYHNLFEQTGLTPVFIGQIGKDEYSQNLKSEFKECRFLQGGSVISDFETIRHAPNVALSISSFGWMATFLSKLKKQVYVPVGGFLNPKQRPDIDLLPANDPVYTYFSFDEWKFNATKDDFDAIFKQNMQFHGFTPRKLSRKQAERAWFIKSRANDIHIKIKKLLNA